MDMAVFEKRVVDYLSDILPLVEPSREDLIRKVAKAPQLQTHWPGKTLFWIIVTIDRLIADGHAKLTPIKKGSEKGKVRLTLVSQPEPAWFQGSGDGKLTPAAILGVVGAAEVEIEITTALLESGASLPEGMTKPSLIARRAAARKTIREERKRK